MNKSLVFFLSIILFAGSCKKDDPKPTVEPVDIPAFYQAGSVTPPQITQIASGLQGVREPQDLDFHPTRANELWIINKGSYNSGGSTVTLYNAGLANQTHASLQDGNAWHFMALPSAISFSASNGNFATSANILDANRNGGSFTGPTLWSSDPSIYAQDPGIGLNGSHLDMLHGSPYGLGIHSDGQNAFWMFDGYNKHICWYNFSDDHGPGHDDHSDGVIYRYPEMKLSRDNAETPSHIVKDDESGILFICEAAKGRILWMNTTSGSIDRSVPLINEQLASHQQMKGLEWGVFAETGLSKPCGIEVIGDILYISDNATGEIIAYNKESKIEIGRIDTGPAGIMGIKADSNGSLWYVNALTNKVHRIDPK